MYRIAEEQEMQMRDLLNNFKSSHTEIRIEPRMLDISSCFLGKDGKVSVPKYWYNGEVEPAVMAYVVRDGPILKKFNVKKSHTNEGDRKVYERIPYKESTDFKVLTMLCAKTTRNTAMSEFLDFKWESQNPAGISTLDKRILKIEDYVRTLCRGDFNPLNDNAFIFCREKKEEAENAVRLNAIWMGLIGKYGERFLDYAPFPYETALARKVLPQDFFSDPTEEIVKRESYQHGIKAHTKESEWFVAKMAERYTEKEKDFSSDLEVAKNRIVEKKRDILDLVESRGDDGIDFMELYYGGDVKRDEELGEALALLYVEGGFGCVIQDPPNHYLKEDDDLRLFLRFYGRYNFFRIYSNEVVGRMVREGKAVEALGFGVPQLPHYVLVEKTQATAQ